MEIRYSIDNELVRQLKFDSTTYELVELFISENGIVAVLGDEGHALGLWQANAYASQPLIELFQSYNLPNRTLRLHHLQ